MDPHNSEARVYLLDGMSQLTAIEKCPGCKSERHVMILLDKECKPVKDQMILKEHDREMEEEEERLRDAMMKASYPTIRNHYDERDADAYPRLVRPTGNPGGPSRTKIEDDPF